MNINCEILKAQNNFPKINKGFSTDNLTEKNRLDDYKNKLKDMVYHLISHLKKNNKDFVITLKNITWETYENFTETMGEASWCRIDLLQNTNISSFSEF